MYDDSSADDAVDTVQTEPRVLHLHHRHALAAHFYTRAIQVISTVGETCVSKCRLGCISMTV